MVVIAFTLFRQQLKLETVESNSRDAKDMAQAAVNAIKTDVTKRYSQNFFTEQLQNLMKLFCSSALSSSSSSKGNLASAYAFLECQ